MRLFPKLALTVLAILTGAIGTLSMTFYITERRHIRQEAVQEQQAVLQNLVHIAQESSLSNDDLLLVKYTRWLQKWNPSLLSASVAGTHGEILAHSEPSRIGQTMGEQEKTQTGAILLSSPVRLGNRWLGTASASFSEKNFDDTVRARLQQLGTRVREVTLLSLVLGLGISFLIALSWTRPIDQLAQAAGRIGQGKWDVALDTLTRRRDELGLLSQAFHTMAQQLKQLDTMKEDFVSTVTHELRSPLGAIESYLNLISEELREGVSPSAWEGYVERMRLNTQRLSRFVNDLLDVAALERGKISIDKKAVDMPVLVQDVMDLFRPKLREKNLTGKSHFPDCLPPAFADADKIRQVLVNLLSNAIKFTPEGGRIQISAKNVSGSLKVCVSDTGIGIAEKDTTKIFNKFEQVQASRQKVKGPKGTGLGLAISRALVERHGGILGVESNPGRGSVFFFTLPIALKE